MDMPSENKTVYRVVVEDLGEAVLALDNDRGFSIISELELKGEVQSYAMRRGEVVIIPLGVEKGLRGLPGVFTAGKVLYTPIDDGFAIVLEDFKSLEQNYVEIGEVVEGLDLLRGLEGVRRAVVKRL